VGGALLTGVGPLRVTLVLVCAERAGAHGRVVDAEVGVGEARGCEEEDGGGHFGGGWRRAKTMSEVMLDGVATFHEITLPAGKQGRCWTSASTYTAPFCLAARTQHLRWLDKRPCESLAACVPPAWRICWTQLLKLLV
jgi:hypothetical protein